MCARIVILILVLGLMVGCSGGTGGGGGSVPVENYRSCILNVISAEKVPMLKSTYQSYFSLLLNRCTDCTDEKQNILRGIAIDQALKDVLSIADYNKLNSNLFWVKSIIYLMESNKDLSSNLKNISCEEV